MNGLLSVYGMFVVQKLAPLLPRHNLEYMEVKHYHMNVNITTVSLLLFTFHPLCLELCSPSPAAL